MVAACGTWHFGLQVVGLVWSCSSTTDQIRYAGPEGPDRHTGQSPTQSDIYQMLY
jgi:hypothetical protein